MSAPSTRARVGELIAKARQETGLDDFGGDTWREGLEVLVGSALTESTFTELGEDMFYGGLVNALKNRLEIEGWFARNPEIDDEVVEVELLGVGFPRTGSTALSQMLGEDSSVRSLRVWEAGSPCPPPGVSPEADAARIKASTEGIELQNAFMPQFAAMLPQSGTGPIEDHQLMELEFKSQIQLAFAHVPTYADWFIQCDMEPTYRYEKRVLKLLQWRTPVKRWQLKSPTHSLFLDAFDEVFPGTRFVMTHRDVSKVLPSVSDLYATLLAIANDEVDKPAVGAMNVDHWGTALDRMLAFRSAGNEDRFHDIGFSAFQADPIAEIRGLYTWLGRELTPETAAKMQAWRDANPRDKHGTHEYAGADFGITEEALQARFGAYRARFGELL